MLDDEGDGDEAYKGQGCKDELGNGVSGLVLVHESISDQEVLSVTYNAIADHEQALLVSSEQGDVPHEVLLKDTVHVSSVFYLSSTEAHN